MKTKYVRHRSSFASLLRIFFKNLITLFDSGEKKDFQRLKDFISS